MAANKPVTREDPGHGPGRHPGNGRDSQWPFLVEQAGDDDRGFSPGASLPRAVARG
jgi:hypothetical protein